MKRRTISCYLLLDFHVKTGTKFALRDKQLFEISEVEIMRVDCISLICHLLDSVSTRKFYSSDAVCFSLQKHNAVSQVLKTSKYLAAISTGFLVAVSPWTICTFIIAVTNIKLHEDLDFAVTWLAISNSFWNVVIYSIMNRKFR